MLSIPQDLSSFSCITALSTSNSRMKKNNATFQKNIIYSKEPILQSKKKNCMIIINEFLLKSSKFSRPNYIDH